MGPYLSRGLVNERIPAKEEQEARESYFVATTWVHLLLGRASSTHAMEQRSFRTHIAGLSLVRGCKFHDNRGLFEEVYNERDSPSDIRVDKLRQVVLV